MTTTTKTNKNAEQTKKRILDSASVCFSERGFSTTGIRDIAKLADVAPALIIRYYDSKENLFQLAMEAAYRDNLANLLAGTPETFGRDMVDYLYQYQTGDISPLAMQLTAISDPKASQIVTEALKGHVLEILERWLANDEAQIRAELITAVLSGAWIYRDLIPLPSFSKTADPVITNWLAETLQRLATEPLLHETT